MHRFFVNDQTISVGATVQLDEQESWHLVKVLRKHQADQVKLFNNTGYEYLAEIVTVNSKAAKLKLIAGDYRDVEPLLNLVLAIALIKGKKMDWIIQKSVELGVNEIMPVVAPRSIPGHKAADWKEEKLKHWSKIVIEATKQCGRTRLTKVHPIVTFSQALVLLSGRALKIISWVSVEEPTLTEFLDKAPLDNKQKVAVVIGPEGGFSENEITEASRIGFQPVSLGKRILRTETAAIVAVSLILSHFGEF